MENLLMAIELAKKLKPAHLTVLEYFVKHERFEGSYRELATLIYGKTSSASNLRKYIKDLEDLGICVVAVNDDCPFFDTNRTMITINKNWDLNK